MAKKHNSFEMMKKRLVAEMARDKKKAGILITLAVVAIFFVGKLLFKSAPAGATAAPVAAATGNQPGTPGMGSFYAPSGKGGKTGASKRKKGDNEITRDIFKPNSAVFPLALKKTPANEKVSLHADAQSERNDELKRKRLLVEKEALTLQLESTITGRVPIAIINGTVLGRGGVVKGFRVVEIGSQACVVEKNGVRLTLNMR